MFLLTSIVLAIFVLPESWRVPVILAGGVIEFVETSISIWISRRGKVKIGPEALIGSMARVIEACAPDGQVRVRGETWRARCHAGAEVDERVRVVERTGLTLIVEPVAPQDPETGSTRR